MRRLLPQITLLLALVAITGTASAGSQNSPGLSPPLNTSAPTISGNAIRGQTLTASTGAWAGPNSQYSYQWNRCDGAGNTCVALAGAVNFTFLTSDADVSRTLRVSVTATNKNGSTSATSNATSAVSAPAPAPSTSTSTSTSTSSSTSTSTSASTSTSTTTPTTTSVTTTTTPTTTTSATTTTTTTSPSGSAYLVDSFDSLPGIWNPTPSPFNSNLLFKVPNGSGGNAAAMVVTPSSSGPNTNSEMTSVWTGNGDARIHTGLGEDTWYRVRVRFPSGKYFPTTGQWNWLVAWHDDGHTTSFNSSAYSSEIGVYTDYPVISGAVGNNPQLVLRLMGGNTMSPTTKTLSAGSLAYDHWYELLIHFVWHPSQGSVEWYRDGQLVGSTPFPTLYQNPDGTVDHPSFGLYNYRLHDPVHTSEIDFDLTAVGPTRASVGG